MLLDYLLVMRHAISFEDQHCVHYTVTTVFKSDYENTLLQNTSLCGDISPG